MEQLDTFLRAEVEPLQYVAFLGSILVLGIAEAHWGRSHEWPDRGRRWPVNSALTFVNILVMGAVPITGVYVADLARDVGYGFFNLVAVGPFFALLAGFLVRSFASWLAHLAMHKVPLLWRVHRVHHTDTFLDVSTTVRFHPLEFFINMVFALTAIVAFGISPVILMLYEVFDAAMAVFTHANVRLPVRIERALRLVLVTPDMHRVHHSSFQPETDSNYGATLSIWDRLFGSYRDKEPECLAVMQLGLEEVRDRRARSFLWLLTLPLKSIRLERTTDESCGNPAREREAEHT